MTTHADHDHPNTKAARAACRKAALNGQTPTTAKQGSEARHPAGKKAKKPPAPKITKPVNTSLPHEYDDDANRPGFCYVCRLTKRARVHDEGPRDLGMLFSFGGR